MQRYFVNEKSNDKFILTDSDIHHIKKVMRRRNNDKIEVVYNNTVYLCNIDDIYVDASQLLTAYFAFYEIVTDSLVIDIVTKRVRKNICVTEFKDFVSEDLF